MKVQAARVDDIAEGTSKCVKLDGLRILLVKEKGEIFALENKCPHFGLSMEKGAISNGNITCPWHGELRRQDRRQCRLGEFGGRHRPAPVEPETGRNGQGAAGGAYLSRHGGKRHGVREHSLSRARHVDFVPGLVFRFSGQREERLSF